jgi:hypothetical protein
MENTLYDLADFLDDLEIKGLKQKESTLLKNSEKIKLLLSSNHSLKQQIEKLKEDLNVEISVFTYRNFLIKYFKKSYEEHTINKVFANCKVIVLDLILNKKIDDSVHIYEFLIKNKMLKKVKNDDKSIITYEKFLDKLKEYTNLKHLSIKIEDKIENADIEKEIAAHSKDIEEVSADTKVNIELLDGSLDPYNIRFLTYSYIFKKHSKKKYDFDEKNYIVIPTSYNNKKLDFEKIKNLIFEENLIKNYSLIFHDNKLEDGFLYIYRLINKKLHLLEKINSRESSEFEDYYKKGVNIFLNNFENFLNNGSLSLEKIY